jgi:hypothetical protein
MKIGRAVQVILKFALEIREAVILVLLVGGIYELAVEMDSGALIYTSSFTKFGSPIQKLIGGIHIHIHRQIDTHIHTDSKVIFSAYFYFFSKYGK